MKLDAASCSDAGKQRENNEDRVWSQVFTPSEGVSRGLFIVCDGMGGYLGGEHASHWAVETVKRELADLFSMRDPRATVHLTIEELDTIQNELRTRQTEASLLEERLRQAVQRANQVVFEYAQKKPEQAGEAGTTITMALVSGSYGVFANVGDSRAYLYRDGSLRQITRDHSLVARMVELGQISPQDIFAHPQRNVIYRSLGQKRDVQVDTFVEILKPGDWLLLCSDGLWEMVRDETTMAELLTSSKSPEQACTRLIEAANRAGGEDNIGVIVVHVS